MRAHEVLAHHVTVPPGVQLAWSQEDDDMLRVTATCSAPDRDGVERYAELGVTMRLDRFASPSVVTDAVDHLCASLVAAREEGTC